MKTTPQIALLVVTLGSLSSPTAAAAQERSGFWFSVGGGPGSAGVSCDDCGGNDRLNDGTGFLKGGWTLNPQTLVGLEFDLWSQQDRSSPLAATLNLYNVSGTLTYYPRASSAFFVKGGAGVSIVDLDGKMEGTTFTAYLGNGLGIVAGAGYDFRMSRRLSLTTGVDYWYGRIGEVTLFGDALAKNWKQNIIAATVGITFQ